MTSKFDDSGLKKKLDSLSKVKHDVMTEAYKLFLSYTPVKSGNAKRKTTLQGDTIEAKYNYASVLDGGRRKEGNKMVGSDQAPTGMTTPTKKVMTVLVDKAVAKRGR